MKCIKYNIIIIMLSLSTSLFLSCMEKLEEKEKVVEKPAIVISLPSVPELDKMCVDLSKGFLGTQEEWKLYCHYTNAIAKNAEEIQDITKTAREMTEKWKFKKLTLQGTLTRFRKLIKVYQIYKKSILSLHHLISQVLANKNLLDPLKAQLKELELAENFASYFAKYLSSQPDPWKEFKEKEKIIFVKLFKDLKEQWGQKLMDQFPDPLTLEKILGVVNNILSSEKYPSVQDYFLKKLRLEAIAEAEGIPRVWDPVNAYHQENLRFYLSLSKSDALLGKCPSNPYMLLNDQDWESLVKNYKVHLMPTEERLEEVAKTLFQAVAQDQNLKNYIHAIKIKTLSEEFLREAEAPKIVIYIEKGKVATQYVLDAMYTLFKGEKGCGWRPKYNEEVTPFLYFAQGDRDIKEQLRYGSLFEQPDKVYYNATFIAEKLGRPAEDYHLVNPAQTGSVTFSR